MPPEPSKLLLETTDLVISVEGTELCHPFSVAMRANESWAILGANGTGKTTLLLTLAGLLPATSGDIRLSGKNLTDFSSRELATHRSMLFQKTDDPFPATVIETVLSARHPHIPYWQTETETDYEIARLALTSVDMSGFEERDIHSLSGGERQRVAIATALAQKTEVRLFDEPANHLDLKHQNTVLRLLTEKSNTLNILVLQDINQAWKNCTHALLLHADNKIEGGSIQDMLTIEKLEALYSCPLKVIADDDEQVFIHS